MPSEWSRHTAKVGQLPFVSCDEVAVSPIAALLASPLEPARTAIKDKPQAVSKCTVSSASSLSVHALATDEWVGTFARALKGEDTTSVMRTVGDDALLMLCLADGHGGAAAAQHCNTFALSHLCEEVAIHGSSGEALRAACTRVFARLPLAK